MTQSVDLSTILRAHGITAEDIADRFIGMPFPELAKFIETMIAEKRSLGPGCIAAIASLVAEQVREADAKIVEGDRTNLVRNRIAAAIRAGGVG